MGGSITEMETSAETVSKKDTDVPEFLRKLAHELRTQDNRITAHPLFCVEVKVRTYGLDPMHHYDGYVWLENDDCEACYEGDDELIEHFDEQLKYAEDYDLNAHQIGIMERFKEDPEWEDDLEELGYYKCYYEERWEFKTAHFTEKAAKDYIRINGHNLPERRIYVTSQYRCYEFNELIEYIKENY